MSAANCKYCGTQIEFVRQGFKWIPMKDGSQHACIPRNREADMTRQREDLEKAADSFLHKSRKRKSA